MLNKYLTKITYLAVFCALCFVSTLFIIIPLPHGYVNAGDVLVLITAWCLGPIGAIATALGGALADVLSGYVLYAPVTLIIKGIVALTGYFVYIFLKKIIRNDKIDFIVRYISAVFAEAVMVVGYFLFESALYGFSGGMLALLGNCLQAIFCAFGATLVFSALYNIKQFKLLCNKKTTNSGEKKDERH